MVDVKFSIIIPHYDIPDLLMRCLKSIPVSEDIQVIVVDDHSPDADTYLERYPELSRPYLEFIRAPKNGGAGYARNIGLNHAKGKWLMFADADDFFVEDMCDIIFSNADSEADVIFFRKKSVLSDNTDTKTNKFAYIDEKIDKYLSNGDEWPIRYRLNVPWGKMIKRNLMVKYNIRFDEVMYADDAFGVLQIGYYAVTIRVDDRVLYVVTTRPGSQTSHFCSKPNELRLRAEAAFRMDQFMLRNDFCREHRLKYFLLVMYNRDRKLFKEFFFKLDEIYPSKLSALRDISRNKPIRFKVKFYLYSLLVWIKVL